MNKPAKPQMVKKQVTKPAMMPSRTVNKIPATSAPLRSQPMKAAPLFKKNNSPSKRGWSSYA